MGRTVSLGFHPAVSYSGRFIRPPILNSATVAASGGCSASSITAATGDACAIAERRFVYTLALRLYVTLIQRRQFGLGEATPVMPSSLRSSTFARV
ncbi:hypothetical protein MRX96_041454 [Rhipicephalus microplus]